MTESDTTLAHEPPSYDDINTPVILLVGAISTIVTLITILFVQGLCYHWQNSYLRKRSDQVENMPAVVQIDKQKSELTASAVTIDDAMKKVVASYGKSSN